MISVVMPAHNEAAYLRESVGRVVAGLRERAACFEVLVCENGSVDATGAVADALSRDHPEVRALHLRSADYGQALRAGFLAARGALVANFDVDLVDLDFLDAALALASHRPELMVIVGTKRGAGADDRRNRGRRWITAAFSAILRYGFGLQASDTHGCKVLRRAPLAGVVARCRFGAEIFDTELILRTERAGLEVSELPVTVADQRPPRTAIARRIPRTLAGLASLRLTLWRESVRPPADGQVRPDENGD